MARVMEEDGLIMSSHRGWLITQGLGRAVADVITKRNAVRHG